MRNGLIGLVGTMALASTMVTAGCGSSSGSGGTGGSSSSGGAVGTGGSSSNGGTVGTGGSSSNGGTVGTGGSSSNGGTVGTGGSSSSGGTVGTGGSSSNGGTVGTGGSSSSGGTVGTGGSSSSGGAVGTGGSSSGGISVTTISNTTALNAADATQLCKDTYAYFGKAIPMATACKYKGLSFATSSSATSDSQFQQVCTDHETACLQSGSGVGSADDPGCSNIPSTCTATVAEYSACISDEVAAFNQSMNGLPSCATATSADGSAVWQVMIPTPPASCDSLTNECQALSPPAPNN